MNHDETPDDVRTRVRARRKAIKQEVQARGEALLEAAKRDAEWLDGPLPPAARSPEDEPLPNENDE